MPSSISNSEIMWHAEDRVVPEKTWGQGLIIALVLFVALMALWEFRALSYGLERGTMGGLGLWAEERRKIDDNGADAIAILGSSRMLYDTNLDVWEAATGVRPIQLANEGTSPQRFLEDLADDPDFTGLVIVGVSSALYYDPTIGFRGERLERYHNESPGQWLGQKIHNRLSHYFAFLDDYNALFHQIDQFVAFWSRDGVKDRVNMDMRLGDLSYDRQTTLWWRVEESPFFLDLVLQFWRGGFERPAMEDEAIETVLAFTSKQVEKIRNKGGDVVFVYPPFRGGYMEREIALNRRERIWDPMAERFDAATIHFQDYPQLSEGMVIPEWSHLNVASANRFSYELALIVMEELEARESPALRIFEAH